MAESEVEIRVASLEDLDGITRVFVECFNQPPWNDGWTFEAARERLEALVTARHSRGAVAVVHGNLIGLLLGQKERWVTSFHFNLQEMCVLPRHQRHGVGRALLRHLTEQLEREGTEKIYLLTGRESDAAAFYAALGFYSSRGRIVMTRNLVSGNG